MDAAASTPPQSKQSDRAHSTTALSKKRKTLLKEKEAFEKEEENMWKDSKALLAQNIDNEENLKQSQRVCKEVSKLLERNMKGLQLVDMRLEAAAKLIKTAMDTVEVTSKATGITVETFIARFEALKIRSENDQKAVLEKLCQDEGVDDALNTLQNSLKHILRHETLLERAESLRKMRDKKERLLNIEYEELLNRVTLLKSNLEIKNSTNRQLQQQSYEAEAKLEDILLAGFENLDEVIMEEKELERQLQACTQECDNAAVELSKLEEESENIMCIEQILEQKILSLKTELKNLTALKRNDPEIISLQYGSICENLQTRMNEKVSVLQNEIKRVQTELNYAESEHASLMIFLGDEQHDWQKEIEDAIAKGKHLEETITVERKASAVLRSKGIEVDIECSRLEMEAHALRENSNAEMKQFENEITDLQNYLKKLTNEAKKETKHYEITRNHVALIVGSAEQTHLQSGDPSADDFKLGAAMNSQCHNATDNLTGTMSSKAKVESEYSAEKCSSGRVMDSMGTEKVPSDIHISEVDKTDAKTVEVIKVDANSRNYYPLPPSAFGSPLSTNDSPDVMSDCELSGSDLDQSIWSDFSSMAKPVIFTCNGWFSTFITADWIDFAPVRQEKRRLCFHDSFPVISRDIMSA
uniref:Uncharacterized protein n=1 Tax=Setaria digitata TaxID=48799 RepID=A0A915PLN0_9BILA